MMRRKLQHRLLLRAPHLVLPSWVGRALKNCPQRFDTVGERMRLAVSLARMNVENNTGGPFGAAVFESETGRLVSVGMNLVVGRGCSMYHAEIVAIMLAQGRLGRFSLDGCELVSSVEPCAMCQGAVIWSGVNRLVYGARGSDARAIGFDEGPKRVDWILQFRKRQIAVKGNVLRSEARAVLRLYASRGGIVYNGGACKTSFVG